MSHIHDVSMIRTETSNGYKEYFEGPHETKYSPISIRQYDQPTIWPTGYSCWTKNSHFLNNQINQPRTSEKTYKNAHKLILAEEKVVRY